MAENLENQLIDDLGLQGLYENEDEEESIEMVDPPQNEGAGQGHQLEHKCFSGFSWEEVIQGEGIRIFHVAAEDYALEEVTELILVDLRSKEPKMISVCCYQVFLSTHTIQEITEQLSIITAAAQQAKIHRLVLASTIYVPTQEKLWSEQAKLNFEIRRLSTLLARPTIPLHKITLFVQPELKTCAVKKACYSEAIAGTGLGENLTPDTVLKVKEWVLKYHRTGCEENAPIGWRMTAWDLKPVPLQYTPGYKNPTMINLLKTQGHYREPKNVRGARRRVAAPRTARPGPSKNKELGMRGAGVKEARPMPFGRGGGSSGYSSRGSAGSSSSYRRSSYASSSRTMSSDSVFEGRSRTEQQLVAELEHLRMSRSRYECEGEWRYGRERQRMERLELALEKAREEVNKLNSQVADLKKENCSLKLDNERIRFNSQEAWSIIREEWRRRDDDQARRERRK
jgi:hypothetical protein